MEMDLLRMFLLGILTAVSNLPSAYLKSTHGDSSDRLFLGKYPTPKKTPDPININSKKVHEANLPPFIIHGVASEPVKVINTGESIEVFVQQPSKTYISGGPLGKNKYIFYKKIYYWTDNLDEDAATTINGKGYPLEDIGIFYNEEYGSYENASKHLNGLAEIDYRISICPSHVSNPLFDIYAKKLVQVQKAGSAVETILGVAIAYFDFYLPFQSSYFTYPGSYNDEGTSKRYYNVIVVIIPHYPYMCISKKQFEETFESFKNGSGQPLIKKAPQFPRKMPVVQAKFIANIIVL